MKVFFLIIAFVFLGMPVVASAQEQSASGPIVITGATLIDGTGAEPLRNAAIVIDGERIVSVGRVGDVEAPAGARVIDARDKYLLPGFIDSNVHATIYGNTRRRETVVKYGHQNEALALEFVQRQLKHGVTTIRDSYGALPSLTEVRDRIASGDTVGPRMLVAGNIVGWGGPFSLTFSLMDESELTVFQEQWNDHIAQDAGEELMDMGPEELTAAIHAYIDKGPDFIKYGGTSHFRFPSLIGFSPRAQKAIVEAAHARGLIAETHATSPEGLLLAVEAGIDLIQHPEILSRDYSDDLIAAIVERGVVCGMRSNVLTGDFWKEHLASRRKAEERLKDAPPATTGAERRRREDALGEGLEIQRRNAERLIAAGCIVSIATDNYQGDAPEFRRAPKPIYQEAGIGSILAIEGLVELGMTEMEALVAGTKNGAIAAGGLSEFGTIEAGKIADLILLSANPLRDISNIRELDMVMARGRVIKTENLPEKRIFSRAE